MKTRSCGFQHLIGWPLSSFRGSLSGYSQRITPAMALKWGTRLSIAKIWPIIGHLVKLLFFYFYHVWRIKINITWKRRKIGGTSLLMTNRKSYMGFRLVPKLVTLNGLERRNGRVVCVISPNSVALGPYYEKWLKIHRYILPVKCSPNNLVLAVYHFWRYLQGNTPARALKYCR